MQDLHAPDPEFTRFLEWQTRTELRRRARFVRPAAGSSGVLRLARTAALIAVSLFAGAGVVVAVERVHESREVEVMIERNQLLLELAERRAAAANEAVEVARVHLEQGLVPVDVVSEATLRAAELERERDHRHLDAEELLMARRHVDRGMTAPLVGTRDFVSEHLHIDYASDAAALEQREQALERVTLLAERGFVSQGEVDQARRGAAEARARLERLDLRLALRADFVAGRVDAATCQRRELEADAEHRLRSLHEDAAHLQRQLARVEKLQAMGRASAGESAPLRAELDRIEVDRRLVELELELLR